MAEAAEVRRIRDRRAPARHSAGLAAMSAAPSTSRTKASAGSGGSPSPVVLTTNSARSLRRACRHRVVPVRAAAPACPASRSVSARAFGELLRESGLAGVGHEQRLRIDDAADRHRPTARPRPPRDPSAEAGIGRAPARPRPANAAIRPGAAIHQPTVMQLPAVRARSPAASSATRHVAEPARSRAACAAASVAHARASCSNAGVVRTATRRRRAPRSAPPDAVRVSRRRVRLRRPSRSARSPRRRRASRRRRPR